MTDNISNQNRSYSQSRYRLVVATFSGWIVYAWLIWLVTHHRSGGWGDSDRAFTSLLAGTVLPFFLPMLLELLAKSKSINYSKKSLACILILSIPAALWAALSPSHTSLAALGVASWTIWIAGGYFGFVHYVVGK